MEKLVCGVYSALLSPRHSDDSINLAALAKLVDYQTSHGMRSYAINGATGEFCMTTAHHLKALFSAVRRATGGNVKLLCGVGGASLAQVLEFAKVADDEGAIALLIPAPYFFPYSQDDLRAFYETVASRVTLPVMLYNLPQFTSGLDVETACALIRDVPNIIGIKDSSGSLDILRNVTERQISCCRIVGNDLVFAQALSEGVCDGVVSGVACVLPEVVQAVFGPRTEDMSVFAGELLAQFIDQLHAFPTPWGLRWGLEALGVTEAWSALPISQQRLEQSKSFIDWFRTWHADGLSRLQIAVHQ